MKLQLIQHNASPRLLLIFAGWGMDPRPFSQLKVEDYDIAIVWDYTDEDLDTTILKEYSEVVILAWSMGVFEASRVLPTLQLPVTLTIAVNGTMTPVNNTTGIPVNIFNATLSTLSEASLRKFQRRMCGSAEAMDSFLLNAPVRDIASLQSELQAIGNRATQELSPISDWDVAVISLRDMIFPANSQKMAWKDTSTIILDAPHLTYFHYIINRLLINKSKVADRFGATRIGYDRNAEVQHSVARRLVEYLLEHRHIKGPVNAIEIGAGSGNLTGEYTPHFNFKSLELWDIADCDFKIKLPNCAITVTDDAETRLQKIPSESIDLVVSASTLQWFNSPARGVAEIERILRPGGTAALSIYVEGTFRSVEAKLGTSLHYATPKNLVKHLCNSYIDLCYTEEHTMEFDSVRDLLFHLRTTGVNALGHSSTSSLRNAIYQDSLRTLEYKTLYLIFTKL